VGEGNTAEVAIAGRVDQVERQSLVGKAFQLLDDGPSEDLLGGRQKRLSLVTVNVVNAISFATIKRRPIYKKNIARR